MQPPPMTHLEIANFARAAAEAAHDAHGETGCSPRMAARLLMQSEYERGAALGTINRMCAMAATSYFHVVYNRHYQRLIDAVVA